MSADIVGAMLAALDRAPDRDSWREVYRHRFGRLREALALHPSRPTAAGTFEAAAITARDVSAKNLPLGLGLVMHLYPLCALRCVALPWFSPAHRRRAQLLRTIDARRLVLANAGSERSSDARCPVTVTRDARGVRVDGTFDYVSLANVADLVLFSAPLAGTGHFAFCVADLHAAGVRIGEPRFGGDLQLSDTCAVTFSEHRVPLERFIEIPDDAALGCVANYQRSWFHLLLAEGYLARIQHLQREHALPLPVEQLASLNELNCLREYALHLLDHTTLPGAVDSLGKVTAAIKLRISWLCQATAAALQGRDEAAARELGFVRLQPTSDDRILRSIGATTRDAA